MLLTVLPTWAANLIVIIGLIIIFAFPITYMVKRKLKGKSLSCDCGCSSRNLKKAYAKACKKCNK